MIKDEFETNEWWMEWKHIDFVCVIDGIITITIVSVGIRKYSNLRSAIQKTASKLQTIRFSWKPQHTLNKHNVNFRTIHKKI